MGRFTRPKSIAGEPIIFNSSNFISTAVVSDLHGVAAEVLSTFYMVIERSQALPINVSSRERDLVKIYFGRQWR